MDTDDKLIGRILPRREVLSLLGVTGLALLSGQGRATEAALACIASPEMTEGPYYVDEDLNRSDIRADTKAGEMREGTSLELLLSVSSVGASCTPLAGALIEVWHCDALGVYSGVQDFNFGDTSGQNYLRGNQVTDENGSVRFITVYPGSYPGRAVHIHFKVLTPDGGEFTSQLFFDDALSDEVYAAEPYAAQGPRGMLNSDDGIFNGGGGEQLVMTARKSGEGYVATYDIGLYTA
jgi:protocatechuate 3,4-dioxygenase beta subunit